MQKREIWIAPVASNPNPKSNFAGDAKRPVNHLSVKTETETRARRSNAWEHQKRALNAAASQVPRADGDTGFGHLKLPGRRTAGSDLLGGNEEGIIVSAHRNT